MEKEDKKWKSVLTWYDVIKIGIALVLGYVGILGVTFLVEQCNRWMKNEDRIEKTEQQKQSSSKENLLISDIAISESQNLREDIFKNFKYGYCAMSNEDGKFGVIDSMGKWVISPEYEGAMVCKDYAIVKVKEGFNMQIDYSGHVLNRYVFDDVTRLWYDSRTDWENIEHRKNTAYCMYTVNGRCGLMDIKGTILTEPIYTDIVAIDKELFLAKLLDGSSHVLIDGKGEVINR